MPALCSPTVQPAPFILGAGCEGQGLLSIHPSPSSPPHPSPRTCRGTLWRMSFPTARRATCRLQLSENGNIVAKQVPWDFSAGAGWLEVAVYIHHIGVCWPDPASKREKPWPYNEEVLGNMKVFNHTGSKWFLSTGQPWGGHHVPGKFLTKDHLLRHKQTYRELWLLPSSEAPAGVQAVFKLPGQRVRAIQTL